MPNRNKIRQWFITYPQWASDQKLEILKFYEINFKLIYYKIAQETHKDGNPHYHIVIKLDEGVTKSTLLTMSAVEYPESYKKIDIKSVRSLKASIIYLSKEDKKSIEHPDGFVETRTPLAYIYRKALIDWANYMGYDTIELYEEYLKKKATKCCSQ